MKVHIPAARNLKRTKNIQIKEMWIELHPDHVTYHAEYVADIAINDEEEKDEALWKFKEGDKVYCNSKIMKSSLIGVDLMRMNDCWRVQILCLGNAELYCLVDKKVHALKIHETLASYIFDKEFNYQALFTL